MRQLFKRTLLALAACACLPGLHPAAAQTPTPAPGSTRAPGVAAAAPAPDAASLDAVRRQLQEQQAEIERLRATLAKQSRLLSELIERTARVETASASRVETASASHANATPATAATLREAAYRIDGVDATDATGAARGQTPGAAGRQTPGAAAQNPQTEQPGQLEGLRKTTETLARQLGSISFGGDLRLRYEGTFGQLNALANAGNTGLVGNELSPRNRLRLRARLALRGQIGPQFDWGLRLATGTTPDVISTNQTLTDFFGRKQFALDQAYLTYRPAAAPGLRLQGGKFETPWLFTDLTWDSDISPEGINESYSRDFKQAGALKNLTFVAWQLPMLERPSAFVLDAAGRLDLDASRRGGRDLALYGAQARARIALAPQAALTLSAADLYFSGTQFITPAQVFGAQLQVPVTVNIPATATSPAQTVTTFASVPRELLVSGSALGLSAASTNATNRDGRLASGFNLVDLIARLELTGSKRFPVTVLFNYVANTRTRDVTAAGGRVIENDEGSGYWAEFQIGKTRERGDWLLNYTFLRIEKDAVLSPFNFSDIAQSTDVRAHRFIAAYAADPRVTLSLTGIVTERPHGLLGVFGSTPPGSLNRPTTRLQLDTSFRF
jgi:hypothetical protein